MKLSLVLPCYNESKSIPDILKRFHEVARGNCELILVNNGSTDNTAKILKKELKNPKYKLARTVLVEKNQGYGFGIMSGLLQAKGEYVGFSHADLQCDPADVFRAFALLERQPFPEKVLVKGNRKGRKSLFTSGMHLMAAILFWKKFDDINGQPKLFHRSLLGKMQKAPKDFALDIYVQYTARKNGFAVVSFPVTFAKRKHGTSHWASSFRSRFRTTSKFIKYMFKLRFVG